MRVTPQVGERLQNVLAARGAASRRGAAELIREGRVAVDGRTVFEPGARVLPEANITLDGRPLSAPEPLRTFLYYKPAGEVCSTDGQGSRSVLEAFDRFSLRLVPVGRLDKARALATKRCMRWMFPLRQRLRRWRACAAR